MATSYQECGDDVERMIRMAIKKWHKPLEEGEVTVGCIFARATGKKGAPAPAIKRNGVACAAKVQITSVPDRVRGVADAKIMIDERAWDELDEKGRVSLIDHELEHLELKGGKDPLDDAGRPKLKMKQHDWEVWGFRSIVERHGKDSLDFQIVQDFREKHGQLLMWAAEPASVG